MDNEKQLKGMELLEYLGERFNKNYAFYDGVCEPGYDDKPVILANWNEYPDSLVDQLENEGYYVDYDDEWIYCDDCGKVFRCIGGSYGWEMYGVIFDGYAICGDCLDGEEYLKSIENDPRKALTCALLDKHNPTDHGYELVQDGYENGLHEHMNDHPSKIFSELMKDDPYGKYIFAISDQSQFYITFSVYKKTD